jgi:MFS family permease
VLLLFLFSTITGNLLYASRLSLLLSIVGRAIAGFGAGLCLCRSLHYLSVAEVDDAAVVCGVATLAMIPNYVVLTVIPHERMQYMGLFRLISNVGLILAPCMSCIHNKVLFFGLLFLFGLLFGAVAMHSTLLCSDGNSIVLLEYHRGDVCDRSIQRSRLVCRSIHQ